MVPTLSSSVRDTIDVLGKIYDIKLEESWLLVGIDVQSLYTSIPHFWGKKAVTFLLEKLYPEMAHQNEFILDLLDFALLNNFFQFTETYYQG